MPIELRYDSEVDAIVFKLIGKIVYEELPVALSRLVDHPDFRHNISQLIDCTDCSLNLSIEDVIQTARDFEGVSETMGDSRWLAIAVSRDPDFGTMRQFEAFYDGGPEVSVMVSRSLSDARQWLYSKS